MERSFVIVDDDPTLRSLIARLVRRRFPGSLVQEVGTAEDALRLLEGRGDGVTVVTDLDLGAGMDGGRFLSLVRERHPAARRVLLTGAPGARADADAVVEKGVRLPGLVESL